MIDAEFHQYRGDGVLLTVLRGVLCKAKSLTEAELQVKAQYPLANCHQICEVDHLI